MQGFPVDILPETNSLEVWIILNSLSFWYSTFPNRQRIIKDQRSWHEGVSWCLPRTSKDLRIPQILWTFWDEGKKRYTTVTTGLFVYAFGARWIPNVTHSNKTFGASKNFLGESAHASIPEIRKPGEGCDRRKLKNFKHFFRTPTTWIISWVKEDKPENWIRVGFH